MLDKNDQLINPEMRIETTNFCNADCIICPREKMTRAKLSMPFDHFRSLISQFIEIGGEYVSLFGFGEPLMDKQLNDKIKYCKHKGLTTLITTNAGLLDKSTAFDILDAGLDNIRFSVHSLNSSDYEEIHKNLKFDLVIENILGFLDLNEKRFNNQCITHVTIIPIKDDGNYESFKKFWEPKVDFIEIWKPHNWAAQEQFRINKLNETRKCFRAFSGPLQIQADGTVIPCCFLTDSEVVLGNTYEQSIIDILKGATYRQFQEMHNGDSTNMISPCRDCDQRFVLDDNPLIYSNRDPERNINTTSSIKFNLEGGN